MQNTLLDILILGLLVLLFGSIYRTRPSARLRYWIIGWLCVLAHFTILLVNPGSDRGVALVASLGLSTLLLSGVSFMLAAHRVRLGPKLTTLYATLLSVPAVLYIFAAVFDVVRTPVLVALAILAEAAVIFVVRRLWLPHLPVQRVTILSALATASWIAWLLVHDQSWVGAYAFLTQVFLLNAVLYWHDFRRWSMGVITAVGGLVAWALVFPTALTMAAFFPHHTIPGEFWNIPKFFVEFGMILTLLESEIVTTSRQREEYRVLFDGNPLPMWITDLQTHAFLRVNRSAVLLYGYSPSEFLSMSLNDICPPENASEFDSRMKKESDATFISGPWTHRKKDGARIQVDTASHSIFFEGCTA